MILDNYEGNVVTSTNPTGGPRAWHLAKVDGSNSLSGVSCTVATTLCVATDSAGNVVTSTNPAGGPRAWHLAHVDSSGGYLGLTGVSCGSPALCVAVDSAGNAVTGQGPVPLRPSHRAVPKISGPAMQGQRLTEAHGSWANSPAVFGYQWQACNRSGGGCAAIPGATSQTFVLRASDVGHRLRVQETAINAGGTSSPATSPATAIVRPAAAQIKAQLLRNLAPGRKASKIAALLGRVRMCWRSGR